MTASARVRAVNPLLAAGQDTTHEPTRLLLDTLRENGWAVKSRNGGAALLIHPTAGTLEVELDPGNTERLHAFIDGRQVPMRVALLRAIGEI